MMKRLSSLILILVILGSFSLHAKKRKKKKKSQSGVILVDGAAVYQYPNFDAPILDYLSKGRKVRITIKSYKGDGGFGNFYKVRIGKKKYGYIADTEIAPKNKPAAQAMNYQQPNPRNGKGREKQNGPEVPQEQMIFSRFMGLYVGSLNFSEEFEGRKLTEPVSVFGLKMNGPELIVSMPIDFELLASPKAPEYYTKFADEVPSGFLLHSSISLPMPLMESKNNLSYLTFGLMATYTSFKVVINGKSPIDSQEVRMGAAFGIGMVHRFGRFAMRLEGKYFSEKTKYASAGLSLQMQM